MKIFISHQKNDSLMATQIATRLRVNHKIESYLDVIDTKLSLRGEDLGAYIRQQMGLCTQLLAVVSYATRASQWVPWEIGVATEKDFPLATFAETHVVVPEFVQSWPVLRTLSHVDEYARASKSAQQTYVSKRAQRIDETASLRSATSDFYTMLRANI